MSEETTEETVEETTEEVTKETVETPDLISQLPDGLKDNETFKDMDVGKLATSYLDIQGKVPVIPGAPDEYNFEFPDGVPVAEADHKLFKDFALEIGLTQDQFAKLNEFDISRIGRMMESYEATRQETWKQIQQETGFDETEIDKRIEEVSKALGLEKLTERLDLKSDPDVAKAMLSIKEKISEDVLRVAASGGKSRPRGPDGTPRLVFKDMD